MGAVSPLGFVLLFLAASLGGLSKTALPGAATIAVAIFAAVLPAKQSTGTLLVLLLFGDLFAVWVYRAHADWGTLRRLVPTVLAGVLVGAYFLAVADDHDVRRVIGRILLVLVAVTLARRAAARRGALFPGAAAGQPSVQVEESDRRAVRVWRRLETAGFGLLAGFTTMVANAGGPVMSMYFLAARLSMKQFLGTAAWFFFVVNLTKTPFSVGLGLISGQSLRLDALLAPAVVIGALLGCALVRRIDQKLFDRLVLALTIVSAAYLLVE